MGLQRSFKGRVPVDCSLVSPIVNDNHVFNNLSFYFKLKMKLFQR